MQQADTTVATSVRVGRAELSNLIFTLDIASKYCFDLGALFRAIRDLSPDDAQAKELAAIGLNLSDDWGNHLDIERETYQKRLELKNERVTA